ncbi:trichohyalin-like isoform X3 [Cygnus olor]|uniref:trichohyalin-like isoform X3 n=1 Tax=Cygnus olor TaxID=8869 RepID=UPI001ADEAFAD|nr:trichohyalin-like isoform X3 [Cygnus olor]
MKKKVSLWAPQTSRFCSDAQRGFGTPWVCCFCSELRHVGQTFPVCSRQLAGHRGAGQPSRELERAGPWTSWMWSFSGAQGWERTPMDTKELEQQPWRSLRQQPEGSALFRECQKEGLNEMLGKSLKGQTEPDVNNWRKTWGSSVQFELIRESYRTCRHRQGWERTPMDTKELEQQPWRSLRQQPEGSALFRECQKEGLNEMLGKSLKGQTEPDVNNWRKTWGSSVQFELIRESYRTCRHRQGWERTPMDTKELEQQPWRSLRQQPEGSALFRECQKEGLNEMLGKSLKGQTEPDVNNWRKTWGSSVQFELIRESYRTCRHRQGWERTPMDTKELEQQPWRSLRQQPEGSALFRECQKEGLNEMLGKSLKGQTEPDVNNWRKTWGSSVQFELIRESYRTCRHRQGWERTPMDTKELEQQPWRSLRQQPEGSALFRECQKEGLNEMLGKSLKGQTEPDVNNWRKTWGSSVQFELIRESYRTCRHRYSSPK